MESLSLWYCDTVVNSPYQLAPLLLALVGAFLYGRDQKKLAWVMIGTFVLAMVVMNGLTHLLFTCKMD